MLRCAVCSFVVPSKTLLVEWRSILWDIGVPFRQELSLREYLSTAKQRLEWQVTRVSYGKVRPPTLAKIGSRIS